MSKKSSKGILILGMIFLVFSIIFFVNNYIKYNNMVSTTGQLLYYEPVKGVDANSNGSFPVVKFKTRDGQEITFMSNVGEGPQIGNRMWMYFKAKNPAVKVRYNPNNPKDAEIDSFLDLYFGPILLLFFSVVFILYYFAPNYKSRK